MKSKVIGDIDNTIENLTVVISKQHFGCRVGLSSEIISKMKKEGCSSITLQYGEWPDLSPLTELSPPLKRIRTQSENVDWNSIMQLENLIELSINGPVKEKIDFKKLKRLKGLKYMWGKNNFESVYEHEGIEFLSLYGAKETDFRCLDGMKSLKELEVVRGNFSSLEGLQSLPNLESIDFNASTKLTDIDALKEMGRLLKLGFSSCNKVEFPDKFEGLTKLRHFSMLRQKNVDSLKFIEGAKQLEVLMFFEMSIKDGDLSFLESMKNLKQLRGDNKRHYNFDIKKYKEKLLEKYGDYVSYNSYW